MWIVLAFVLSALFAVLICGPVMVDPTNTSWIIADLATQHFGWEQYRADPASILSLTTDRSSWPLPMNVSLFDSMPIIAFLLKLIAPLLPANFQYIGPAFVANVGLQGAFAYLLLKESAPRQGPDWRFNVALFVGASFFATAPVLFARLYMGHPSLTAQWLIVAALWLYVRAERVSFAKTIFGFALLCAISAGITPYLSVMVLLVYAGFVLALAMKGQFTRQRAAATLIPLGTMAIALYAFGFLDPFGKGAYPGSGYGYYSSNFNTLFNPMPDYIGSSILPPLPLSLPGQYEGYGYVGVGGLCIIAFGMFYGRVKGNPDVRPNLPLYAVAMAAFILALSRYVSIGTFVGEIHLPAALTHALEIFRSSGRFVWVTIYILLFAAISNILKHLEPKQSFYVLLIGATLQFVDLAGPFVSLHQRFATFHARRFSDPLYAGLGKAHDTLIVMPPWQCGPWQYRRGITPMEYDQMVFEPISNLVIDNHLRTNSFYAGRLLITQADYHCVSFPQQFEAKPLDPHTAYIFSMRNFLLHGKFAAQTHYCDFAEDLFLCRGDRGQAGLSDRAKRAMALVPTAKHFHIKL
ncbi:MAG: hypothetical protein RLZZ366_637 [Pseudomonadota bacterium]